MGFSSQEGQVGFKTQATAGVYSDPGAAPPNSGVFARLRSGSMSANRDLLIPDPEIGGNRDVPDAYLGAVSWSGDYEMYLRTRVAAVLLKGALGDVASTDDAGIGTLLVGTHVITPANGPLPWLSVEENIGGSFETFRYTDAKVNTFHMEAEANGYLMGTAGLISKAQIAGAIKTAVPSIDTGPMFVGTNIKVRYNSVLLPAKSFSLDINNNLEDDDFRLGSLFLGDVTEKRREMTMSVTVRPQDSALWRQSTYGAPAATSAQGQGTKSPTQIICETYEVIGTSAVLHTIQVDVPYAMIVPFGVDPSGDDVIEHDMEVRALRVDPAQPIASFTVKNDMATLP